jgi:hypothetical protein
MSVIRAKSVIDADSQFIINLLTKDIKGQNSDFSWGQKVVALLSKHNIKLKDYVNELRSSFLTNELPMEITSIIIDQ